MSKTETIRFLVVGTIASIVSIIGFKLYLATSNPYYMASIIRWCIMLPIIYIGYSRYVLIDTFIMERRMKGKLKAEYLMFCRVIASVGAGTAAKFLIEPFVTKVIIQEMGQSMAILSPVIADFGYGPLVKYIVLSLSKKIG